MDGNAVDENGIVAGNSDDWNSLFPIDGSPNEKAKVFVADPPTVPGSDDIFTTGGSKDDLDVSSWRWTGGNVPDKDDLTNIYAAAYLNQTDTGDNNVGDLMIYFGADRFASNGDAQIGFWFFQNPIGKNPDGTFSGVHAVGDLLVISDFTGGGGVSTIKVYRWDPTTEPPGDTEPDPNLDLLFTGVDCATASADDPACATVNTSPQTAPWPYDDKFQTPPGTFPTGTFFEGGINLSRLVPGAGCFSTIIGETRSSQSVDAQLKDFGLGNFNLCSIDVQKTGDSISKIGDPTNYTITITNTGVQTLYKDDIVDTVFGNIATNGAAGTLNAGVVINSSTCGGSLASGASCTISITYTIQPGAADPLNNTVTVTYRGKSDLTGVAVTDNDGHSVNLFQPAVTVTKTGPALSKVGDTVTYQFTITNTSSSDSPNLILDSATDSLLGALTPPAACNSLAPGASCNFTAQRTTLQGDPDPLLNTVEVHYHPSGFPNDISDTDDHSVNLFQPAVVVVKSGDTLSKVGDQVRYHFEITNTSSSDTPTLVLDSVTDTLLGTITSTAAANGCSSLIPGVSCGFDVNRTVQQGDPDPLPNTATVHYHPTGFANDISDTDDHSVNLFTPSVEVVKTGDPLSKVGDAVDYTITVRNTSSDDSPDLVNGTVVDTLLGDLLDPSNPYVTGNTCSATLANLGSGVETCTVTATRTVQAGDADPLVNTVTVHFNPDGFSNDITDNDDHSVNLFQPAVTVDKSGDTLSKVGDSVTYNFTITNSGSSDSPNLVLDIVSDTVLGDLAAAATTAGCGSLAPGASCNFTADRTVQAGDSDPLPNTVTVHYHPNGFPNDITDSDDHSVNLFQPSLTFEKTGDSISKVGDTANWTITLSNTSSNDSPDLVCTITDPLLGVDKQVTLASGATDVTNVARITQAGDPDPLVNTASVQCSPQGFPNVLEASDGHSVELFQPSVSVEKTGDELSKVGDQVTYHFVITNTSSADSPNLVLDSITDTLLGNLADGEAPEACSNLAPGASCSFDVNRIVQAGDSDPLPNTVTVHYHPNGFPNDITDSDDHSVNLFQPSITFDKTGDTLSKVGDDVNYTITLTNTGSSDSPDLTCRITDPLLGLDKQVNLASGASDVTNTSRTVQGGDPDPLVNTASVLCTVDGFGNELRASDDHSVNLFQPSVTVDKTGDTLSKVGDPVTYNFTITNTSSSDSPNLVLNSVSDTVLGDLADDAPAACDSLAPGASCAFSVNRTVQQGDPDPLLNTVTVHYHPNGFPNDITDSDDHSVNLFQPSITVDKTGDTLSKVGDDVNYTITLTNTGSSDSPDLTCRITDPLLGLDKQVNLASGASDVTNTSRTVQGGDPDPLVNTASVLCTVDGFGNELRASDDHSVNLFQPSVTVDKTSANPYSKAGDAVRYVFTITNTSSSDSPNLVFDSMTDTLLGTLTPPSSCNSLAPGGFCSFTVDRTVLEGDSDPLPNTVTVHYHPDGFPNDISDSDDHSVDLLHPNYTVTKDCLTEVVPPGGTAIFRITFTNTGDVALNITDDEPQIPDFTLNIGETRVFEVVKQAGSGPIVENTINAVATLPNWTGLPNRLERSATDHCDVRGGATRTLGFWQTHIDYATHVFEEHGGSTMDFGWKVADDIGDVMGIFWANMARQTTGQRRNQVCQARIQGSQQLAAAIFNSWLSNGSVVPIDSVTGLSLIEAMHNALRDGNRNEILRLLPLLDAYNNSGDDIALIDAHSVTIGRAEPKDARGEADYGFADCWTIPH